MGLSVTHLSAHLYCSRKLYLEQVLKLREPEKAPLILGTIRHRVLEQLGKTDEQLVLSVTEKATPDSLFDQWKHVHASFLRELIVEHRDKLAPFTISPLEVYQRNLSFLMTEQSRRITAVLAFSRENRLFGRELWKGIIPKLTPEYKLVSETLGLTGIIDQVEDWKTEIVPVEFKTGSLPQTGTWPGHEIQVGAYALLLEEQFNVPVLKGIIRYLDYDTNRTIYINPFLKQRIHSLIDEVSCTLHSSQLPARVKNKNKCRSCGLKEICYDDTGLEEHRARIPAHA
ncbi:CRISPR-associated protein Cas4 [Candidatus Woesearchaeota archaeon CG_4_10_14_0_8_um_filter_47_5]|nr:MAG: CRISPR-associated protein Cas4 [Candidatus Woesearchaeota archaeon CG_4_10_14_0_8_um_filter_47_5]